MERKSIHIAWPGREELKARVEVDDQGQITHACLLGIGGPEFLERLAAFRPKLKGAVKDLELPSERTVGAIMLRELVLKLKDEWNPPYQDEEICHCRVVPTAVVDLAICTGAHTSRQVSELTSASTACGTCRPDVEALIRYRMSGS